MTYTIQQRTQHHQWEPIPEGDFADMSDAFSALNDLRGPLGWEGLRVVDASGVEIVVDEDEDEEYNRLAAILSDCECSPYDGQRRLVDDSDAIEADGEYWGVVNDHGNVELGYRERETGRIVWIGGLV